MTVGTWWELLIDGPQRLRKSGNQLVATTLTTSHKCPHTDIIKSSDSFLASFRAMNQIVRDHMRVAQ